MTQPKKRRITITLCGWKRDRERGTHIIVVDVVYLATGQGLQGTGQGGVGDKITGIMIVLGGLNRPT